MYVRNTMNGLRKWIKKNRGYISLFSYFLKFMVLHIVPYRMIDQVEEVAS
jgi:hypothetical protein